MIRPMAREYRFRFSVTKLDSIANFEGIMCASILFLLCTVFSSCIFASGDDDSTVQQSITLPSKDKMPGNFYVRSQLGLTGGTRVLLKRDSSKATTVVLGNGSLLEYQPSWRGSQVIVEDILYQLPISSLRFDKNPSAILLLKAERLPLLKEVELGLGNNEWKCGAEIASWLGAVNSLDVLTVSGAVFTGDDFFVCLLDSGLRQLEMSFCIGKSAPAAWLSKMSLDVFELFESEPDLLFSKSSLGDNPFRSLKALGLRGCSNGFIDATLKLFRDNSPLTSLVIDGEQDNASPDWSYLSNAKKLNTLELSGFELGKTFSQALNDASQLKILYTVHCTGYSNVVIKAIFDSRTLEEIALGLTEDTSKKSFQDVFLAKQVKKLSVSSIWGFDGSVFQSIGDDHELEEVILKNNNVGGGKLNGLGRAKNLKVLSIEYCHKVVDTDIAELPLQQLLKFRLVSCRGITSNSTLQLGRLTSVQELDIQLCNWVDQEQLLEVIPKMSKLKRISFRGSNVGDDFLEVLGKIGELISIDVSFCDDVTIEGLESISRLTKLVELFVIDCSSIERRKLQAFINDNPSVKIRHGIMGLANRLR